MLKKVLIANRADIALRVVRACRDLQIPSVAIYSEADRGLRYVREANESVEIGAAPPKESYLAIDKIIAAAKQTGADSIHPGYGFLAENPDLARAAEAAGLIFIGPPAAVIDTLGSKLATRRIMLESGVPVPPGSDASSDLEDVAEQARKMGYPILVKPSGGGGGRGMRVVQDPDGLADALHVARREAGSSFADSDVYVEKLLENARHIEVQIVADTQGNVVHVGDRDCSLQRRHQKIVEEGPAPGLSQDEHDHVRGLAVKAAQAAGYVGVGTAEFLYDGKGFFLLEVNTRIQVEHAVTEVISGIDLVTEQLRIAAGEPLSFSQQDVALRGSAIECRLYAEDPAHGFSPSPGRILAARFPSGPWVREDRCYDVGDEVTPYYDGMISKVIVWGPTREIAIARTLRALAEYRFAGIETNAGFARWLVDSEAFRRIEYDTHFVEREFHRDLMMQQPVCEIPEAPVVAPAPGQPQGGISPSASRVELFVYQRDWGVSSTEFRIHVVPLGKQGFMAIPISPRDQLWADEAHRRTGWTAEEAVDNLVREVLKLARIEEIFPALEMSY